MDRRLNWIPDSVMNLPGKGCVAADFLHEEKQMSETATVKMNSIFFISDIYK